MRIGIFSDVHANIEALGAVVEALKQEGVDLYVSIGDTVGYGASPNECCDVVRELTEATVLGNHDAAVAGRMDYSYYYDAARSVLDNHAALLSDENMAWLQSLPYRYPMGDLGVQFSHGSPVCPEEFDYVFALDQARELLPHADSLPIATFIGHSHLCKVFILDEGEVTEVTSTAFQLRENVHYIISVGSVGQPRDYDNRASFAIYDTERRFFEFRRVEYDIEAAAQKVFELRLSRNFGNRLFIGV
jgi:diadenosine tetraphosphatase ApaH/serine/threonine PP2A family protein phosphatase